MNIAVPREIMPGERRVAAVPETVKKLIGMGFRVAVEAGAGNGIFRADEEYMEAGASIETDTASLYQKADVVLKVKEPRFNEAIGRHEIDMMRGESILVTFIHPAAPANHEIVRMLCDKKISSFTMDGIPRTSRAQKMDALTSMSTVTGYKSVLIAASHLPVFVPMIGTAIGAIKPANCLVIGAGVVGLQAIATAKRLGGVITAFDIRPEAREEARSLGAKIGGFEVPEELAKGKGGYARALPAEWVERERQALTPLLAETDMVIASALVPGEVAPVLITGEMLGGMKAGSVIVDVAIDQGGNCSATDPGQEVTIKKVLISGLKNIPGSMPVHATWLYANNMLHYMENLFKNGPGRPDMEDDIVQSSLVTQAGVIVHEGTLKAIKEKRA